MHGWKLSRCVNINQLLIERAMSHLCPRVEVSNFLRSTLNEKLVFSRLIKVASLTIFVSRYLLITSLFQSKTTFTAGILL